MTVGVEIDGEGVRLLPFSIGDENAAEVFDAFEQVREAIHYVDLESGQLRTGEQVQSLMEQVGPHRLLRSHPCLVHQRFRVLEKLLLQASGPEPAHEQDGNHGQTECGGGH